ncbi:hypothetical protein MKW92_006717 [Papaver armeniacum]|nr:hypothetical protein MKW92_006717 [Papaver armeniacum]
MKRLYCKRAKRRSTNKEKEALSSSEVPTEEKKKHRKSEEIENLSTSEVPTEKKKHKRNKEKEAFSSSKVPKEKKHKKSKGKEALISSEVPTEKKKKKHKRNKEKEALSSSEVSSDVGGAKNVKGSEKKEDFPDNGREKGVERKNKKDKEMVMECSDVQCAIDQVASKGKDRIDVTGEENNEHVKTGKGKKNKRKNENGGDSGECYAEKSDGEAQSGSRSSKKRSREEEVLDVDIGEGKKKKKKKKRAKSDANIENTNANIGDVETQNNLGSTNEHMRNSNSKNSSKRVKFASNVEVFPLSDDQDNQEENLRNKLVQGKRFTRQEDQIIKDAVHNYIEAHELGEEGLDMILNCRKHPNIRTCWKEIGAALPYRPQGAVYERAHTLFERGEPRNWTEDEKAVILKFYEKHGPNWKSLAQVLGKDKKHVKDKWRHIYRAGLKRGKWSQTEYQYLFHLVNKDLQMRVYEEKKSKHGMIRDNISWKAISDRLATRTEMRCCNKWYGQLSSSMVKEGKWGNADDYRLLDELVRLDACCIEDVDWDNLLEHRSGDISLKRWRQMVNHIGSHGLKSFAEQVEVLAKRYCPELLEVREALDSRPVVD